MPLLTFAFDECSAQRSAFQASRAAAFRPAVSTGLRAAAARYASTDSSLTGKIHQVIGAVVDGKLQQQSLMTLMAMLMRLVFSSQVRYRQAPTHS